jgi:hypothetical protein
MGEAVPVNFLDPIYILTDITIKVK